jgi:hypothetical protein
MKRRKIIFWSIFGLLVIFGLFYLNSYKPKFKDNDQALSYLWSNTINGSGDYYGHKEIKIGKDSTIFISTNMNYCPSWNRSRIYISLETKNSKSNFIAECTGAFGWFKYNEEDDPKYLYLNPFSDEDVKLLKIAYNAFEK